jgi:DNA-binding XRE family transcriptional regulator
MSRRYHVGNLTGPDFRHIRHGLLMTQREMARALGYAQTIRISEYERETNPVPIPLHIQEAAIKLYESGGRGITHVVRQWTRQDEDGRHREQVRLWRTGTGDTD